MVRLGMRHIREGTGHLLFLLIKGGVPLTAALDSDGSVQELSGDVFRRSLG